MNQLIEAGVSFALTAQEIGVTESQFGAQIWISNLQPNSQAPVPFNQLAFI